MKTIAAMLVFVSLHTSPIDLSNTSKSEMFCLSKAIYHEARGEPIDGQIAVAHVILNRTKSQKYPPSVCSVVYQEHQFTDIRLSKPNFVSKEWNKAVEVAIFSSTGIVDDPTNGAMYYYNPKKVTKTPNWVRKLKIVTRIKNHVFLKEN